jgi:hypothetical protein
VTWGFGLKLCFWLENAVLNTDYAYFTDFFGFMLLMANRDGVCGFAVNRHQLSVNSCGIRGCDFSVGADWVCLFRFVFGGRGFYRQGI